MKTNRLHATPAEAMRVLLAENDRSLGTELLRGLRHAGLRTDWVQWGAELRQAVREGHYACVLLDLGLPDLPGEAALHLVREADAGASVIVIAAAGSASERIRLLDLGADDHLTRPVDAGEVAARVRAVTRRAHRARTAAVVLVHGPLCLQVDRRSATWHGQDVPLTNMEFWLLETLVRRRRHALSRTVLEELLYGWGEQTNSNTVEVHVHHLRRKFVPALIRTRRGVGYQIGLEEELAASLKHNGSPQAAV